MLVAFLPLGLTVFAMMRAFNALSVDGKVDTSEMASAIQNALILTAISVPFFLSGIVLLVFASRQKS